MASLEQLARDLNDARDAGNRALAELRRLVSPLPALLLTAHTAEVGLTTAEQAWRRWDELLDTQDQGLIAAEAEHAYTDLATAVETVRNASEQALERHRQAWQPVATAITQWAEVARASQRAEQAVAAINRTLSWLNGIGQELRDARLAPVATQATEIWTMLRQESNVDLGRIQLAGTGNRRHVKLDVTLDGEASSALAVMSQGELHALALALFLPRATMRQSPFRFLVIDDPVQSMDPAKVHGLARVLDRVAQNRQVLVFTHDDRLAQAVRHLQLRATILEVTRAERSVVKVRACQDPVARYLDDALAIARTDRLPERAKAPVVAGFVRSAVEAACHELVRTRKLKAGVGHAAIEDSLTGIHRLRETVALALFDDPNRWKDVDDRVRRLDARAPALLDALNRGVHGSYQGRLADVVSDGRRLAKAVRNL